MAQIQAPVFTGRDEGGEKNTDHKGEQREAPMQDTGTKESIDIQFTYEVLNIIETHGDAREMFQTLDNKEQVGKKTESVS